MCDIKSFRVTGGTVNFTTPCFYFISVLPLKSNGRQNVQGSEKKKERRRERNYKFYPRKFMERNNTSLAFPHSYIILL